VALKERTLCSFTGFITVVRNACFQQKNEEQKKKSGINDVILLVRKKSKLFRNIKIVFLDHGSLFLYVSLVLIFAYRYFENAHKIKFI
jgi:hypothetical protein